MISQLRETSQLLGVVYSTCVTAELALQGQNGDQDHDILTTLRIHVSDPVSRQIEEIDSLVGELTAESKEQTSTDHTDIE